MNKQNTMVHWAVLHGNLQLVMEILDRYQLIDETNFFGETALALAVRYGYQDIAQYLIQQGADVHLGTWSPVWIAARLGDLSMIELLGASPSATCNPLVAAMQHDHFEVFEYLHRELGYQFGDDWLLQTAVQLGGTKFVRYILEHTNEPTMVDEIGYAGFNPLMTAAISGHSDVFELLLEFGANPSVISDYDYTMLHCAVSGSNQKIIDFVLQLPNVDLNAVTKDDGNPLKIAIGQGNLGLVRYLLGKGAKPRVEDVIFSGKNFSYNILQVLLDQDSTLLDAAPESVGLNWTMVEHLIARGFNLNAQARDGYTTLHVAAAVNNLKICNLLIDSGCDINTFSYDHQTALVIALGNKYIKLAKLLLDRGADREAVRNFRYRQHQNATLLHKFARINRRFMVRYLLEEFNFDKTVTDDEGKTALDWAREAGHDDVVRLLA